MARAALQTTTKPKTGIRRTMRKQSRFGDQMLFVTKSSSVDDGTHYHPAIDVKTGEWMCDCPSATYRPNIPCKHAVRAVQNAIRSGDAAPSLLRRLGITCCFRCFGTEQLFPMAHDDGSFAHDVFVCGPCTVQLRAEAREAQ